MTHTTLTSSQLPSDNGATLYNESNVRMIVARAHLQRAEAISNDIDALVSGVKKMISGLRTYLRIKATVRTLENLSDTVLSDIGIERAQIPSIARELRNGTYGVTSSSTAKIETFYPKAAGTVEAAKSDMPIAA